MAQQQFDPWWLPFNGRLEPFKGLVAGLWRNLKMDEEKHVHWFPRMRRPSQKAVGTAFACQARANGGGHKRLLLAQSGLCKRTRYTSAIGGKADVLPATVLFVSTRP